MQRRFTFREICVATDWNGVVREYGPVVYRTAWRILGQAADAEDVLQEVFLEAQRLRAEQPVEKWAGLLQRMTTFRALDCLRQRKPAQSIDGVSIADRSHGPEADAMGHELEQRLRDAVARLPEQQSAVFCLRYFEDLSYQQIAASLEISANAVATALHKARARLEELLEEAASGTEP